MPEPPIGGALPDITVTDPIERESIRKALEYMAIQPGKPLLGRPVDVVFLGSWTNGRMADLRSAASVLEGRKVNPHVRVMVAGVERGEAPRRGRRPARDFLRVRRGVARGRLLDVHRHERRPALAPPV
jgi:hypothetical protein